MGTRFTIQHRIFEDVICSNVANKIYHVCEYMYTVLTRHSSTSDIERASQRAHDDYTTSH